MRLIRSVRQPAVIALSRQFQKCLLTRTSTARICLGYPPLLWGRGLGFGISGQSIDSNLHPALFETSSLVHGSNILWRGRSYSASASASSDGLEDKKPRRKVSKNERKSMVENYVKKYREKNAGKFPTASDARKDVGGSYYVVRQILQELIYNSKQSSVDTGKTSLEKISMKKDEMSTEFGEVSQTRELGKVMKPILKEDIGNSSSKIFEPKEGQQSSIPVETDKSKNSGNSIKQETFEGKLKSDGLQTKALPQETTEISRRELQKEPTEDAEPQTKSSVWNNLKSFANEILSIWKRS